jgi:tetratricopeptide (TPR) repeat protein
MSKLDNNIYSKIVILGKKADNYLKFNQFNFAIKFYVEALTLLPEPITDWEASTWILTSIGDAYFNLGNFERARQALIDVMHCPNAIGNPFIHLRLGQVQFELGNMERAQDELVRAYLIEGEEIFKEDDPKYLNFIKWFIKQT